MDCIIPGHSVRTFSASVACLAKIGKELYVDFDPLDGLSLRTLNDAKSAYGHFRFTPSFFERCSAPPTGAGIGTGSRARASGGGGRGRSRSRSRSRSRPRPRAGSDSSDNNNHNNSGDGGGHANDYDEEDDDDGRFLCRVSLRTIHSVLRSRKGVSTLRIRSVGVAPLLTSTTTQSQSQSQTGNNTQEDRTAAAAAATRMQLSFEFVTENVKTGGTMKIVHRINVSDADGVAAVASRSGCSELVAPPTVLRRLLDPLKRTTEVALTVDDVGRTVTATSFHHGDAVVAATSGGAAAAAAAENAVLNAAAASVLKTETSIPLDEFVEYSWRDDRKVTAATGTRRGEEGGDDDDEEQDEDDDDGTGGGGNPPPSKVNEEVTLVFGIKEAKAMLQFCAQASHDIEMDAIVSFHWGGRPIIIDAEEESGAYRAELILATLDHKLLGRGVRSRPSPSSGGGDSGRGSGSNRGSGGRSGQ